MPGSQRVASSSQDHRTFRVREVADLSGVTVRTLHHYDAVGLLTPSGRSSAGYRIYDVADLERLQEILFHRELGLTLHEIGRLLDEPNHSRRATLLEQRRQLLRRREQLDRLLTTIDQAISDLDEPGRRSNEMSEHHTDAQRPQPSFDGFDPARHEAEVETRWGGTEAYAVSKRRTADYGPEDWQRLRKEEELIAAAFARLMTLGTAADDHASCDTAEQHRVHIDQAYYPCSHEMHVALADLYTQDDRFRSHWDDRAPGLAAFVRDAIRANAARRTTAANREALDGTS